MTEIFKGGHPTGVTLDVPVGEYPDPVPIGDRYGNPIDLTLDAFGRLRTSGPTTIFDSKQIDIASQAYLYTDYVAGGASATYVPARSATDLVAPADDSVAVRQTRRAFNYQPGKGQKIELTFHISGAGNLRARVPEDTSVEVGYCNDQEGVLLQVIGGASTTATRLTVRSSTIGDESVLQALWNLDNFDGSGSLGNPSGLSLDLTKVQILSLGFEWLGVGGVLAGFVIDNRFCPAHFFAHANSIEDVYMRTPDLPLRWKALAEPGSAAGTQLTAICGSVISEGGFEPLGATRSDYLSSAVTTATGTVRELLSLRLASSTTDDAGLVQTFSTVFPEKYSVLNTSNDSGNVLILFNPTFVGAGVWGAPPGEPSKVQVSKTGRVISNVGTVLYSELFSAQSRSNATVLDRLLALSSRYNGSPDIGVPDVISLALANTSGSSTVSLASLGWREL